MFYFEIKTHRVGITYAKPHFFILNKGLNSGKPLEEPCFNCYVIMTKSQVECDTLYHLSMMLLIGGFYKRKLKGSVIPFITINDCSKTLKEGLFSVVEVKKHIELVQLITQEENRITQKLEKIRELKQAYIQSCFSNGKSTYKETS